MKILICLTCLFLCGTLAACSTDTGSSSDESIIILDGDRTYVDNEVMLPLMCGTWKDDTEKYTLTYDGETLSISIDEISVLTTEASFTHLEPGGPDVTSLDLETDEIKDDDGNILYIIEYISYDPDEACMSMHLINSEHPDDESEIILKRAD